MKYLVSFLILSLPAKMFSQFSDTLILNYVAGYDCSKTINSKSMRGACENWEKIKYVKRKQVYRIKSFDLRSSFREWKGGFGSNQIADSIKSPTVLKNRELPAKELEDFLREICSVQSDTIFPYLFEEISETFLKKNGWAKENRDSIQIDSLIHDSFNSIGFSSIVSYFNISFRLEGKEYELFKDPNNPYWRLYLSEDKSDKRIKFIYFAFDAFLSGELPKKFSGKRMLL